MKKDKLYYCINKNELGELHIKRQLPYSFHAKLRDRSRPCFVLHSSFGANDGGNDFIPKTALSAPRAGGRKEQRGAQSQNCRSSDNLQRQRGSDESVFSGSHYQRK